MAGHAGLIASAFDRVLSEGGYSDLIKRAPTICFKDGLAMTGNWHLKNRSGQEK